MNNKSHCACTRRRACNTAHPVACVLCVRSQWNTSQERLFPTTFVSLIDVAPMFGLVPLFVCYSLALVAALQQLRSRERGVLHGVKSLKTMCTILMSVSSWHQELCHRGPWRYDWTPPMAQLVREFSASYLVTSFLEEPERLPNKNSMHKAMAELLKSSAEHADEWRQLLKDLESKHAQLDTGLSLQHIEALAVVLARLTSMASACKLQGTATQ
jgi:hypothetical protein